MDYYASIYYSTEKFTGLIPVNEEGTITSAIFPYFLAARKTIALPTLQEITTRTSAKYDSALTDISFGDYDFFSQGNSYVEIDGERTTETTVTFSPGTHTIRYYYYVLFANGTNYYRQSFTYTFVTILNRYPTKPWSVLDVLNRVLDLEKPLFSDGIESNEVTPRYIVDPTQAAWLDSIQAPELTMTRSTLREQLKLVGGFIHAEARVIGEDFNIIHFDRYGGTEPAFIQTKGIDYIFRQTKQDINQYCTGVDSITQNMVNQLRYGDGTTTTAQSRSRYTTS